MQAKSHRACPSFVRTEWDKVQTPPPRPPKPFLVFPWVVSLPMAWGSQEQVQVIVYGHFQGQEKAGIGKIAIMAISLLSSHEKGCVALEFTCAWPKQQSATSTEA